MTAYGLLITGFALKPETAIKDDLDAGCLAFAGPSVPLGPKTLLGEYNGVVAAAIAEVWELAQAVDASDDPDAAVGAGLEQVCAITATQRDPATPSTVTLTLTGTPGTLIATGSRAGSLTTAAQFATTADAVPILLDDWLALTLYAAGDRVTNTARAYVCIEAGTSAASGGPITTSDDETDGTAHWRYLGEGTGAADAESECTVTGPTEATSGDLTVIVTPVGGWNSVVNLLDADVGSDV